MLTDNNKIFRNWFVIIHRHPTKVSVQIIRCIIFERNELCITLSTLWPYPMVVHTTIVSRWPPMGGLDSEFPSLKTPAHDRQGTKLTNKLTKILQFEYKLTKITNKQPRTKLLSIAPAKQFGPRLLIGYLQLIYACAYTCTHKYIYICIHIYIRMHTYVKIVYTHP